MEDREDILVQIYEEKINELKRNGYISFIAGMAIGFIIMFIFYFLF